MSWKIDICTFPSIYGRLANSSGRKKTTCLKSRLKSARNARELEKHCFLMYCEFQSIQGFLNTLENMCDRYCLTYSTSISYQTMRYL